MLLTKISGDRDYRRQAQTPADSLNRGPGSHGQLKAHTMTELKREDLLSLEQYSEQRPDFRARVMAHKKNRRVDIGPNLSLYFEDRLTIQYQVQEMLRIERIFEAAAIQEELDTYNPLISGNRNLKCTAMLEFTDVDERRRRLSELVGIEHRIWARVNDGDKVFAISNEDLERSTENKTSAVHFMRFEFSAELMGALQSGAQLSFGSDHASYPFQAQVSTETQAALILDSN
jgi:hypothetical protein